MNLFRAVTLLLAVVAIACGIAGFFLDDVRDLPTEIGYAALCALGIVLLGAAARDSGNPTRVR